MIILVRGVGFFAKVVAWKESLLGSEPKFPAGLAT